MSAEQVISPLLKDQTIYKQFIACFVLLDLSALRVSGATAFYQSPPQRTSDDWCVPTKRLKQTNKYEQ